MPKIENSIANSSYIAAENNKKPFSIMGMSISGLDIKDINYFRLVLKVDLKPGESKLSFNNKDIFLTIKPNTKALVTIDVEKNIDKPYLKSIKLEFENHSAAINNPLSFIKNKNIFSLLADSVANLKIQSLVLAQDGNININSKVQLLGFIHKKINPQLKPITMPDLENMFLDHMDINNSGILQNINIKSILKDLGAITDQGHFNISLEGPNKELSLKGNGIEFRGNQRKTSIYLSGLFELNHRADLSISINEKSQISSSFGETSVQANIGIAKAYNLITHKKSCKIKANAEISNSTQDIFIQAATDKAVTQMMPRKHYIENDSKDIGINTFNTSFGANYLEFSTQISLNTKINKDLSIDSLKGKAKVNASFTDAFGLSQDRGVELSGKLNAKLDIQEFNYHKNDKFITTNAAASFVLDPSVKIKEKFPGISPLELDYKLVTNNEALARIVPSKRGVTHFLYPVKNLEGHYERINGDLTKGPLYKIGNHKYFEQIKKITGARIRNTEHAQLLIDGKESLPQRLKIINEAQNFICFQTLVFKNDNTGKQYAQALIEAAQKGVKVYGIIDSLGNIESFDQLEKENPIYASLKNNGVKLYLYNSFLEDGLRELFYIVDKYPEVFGVMNAKNTKNIHQIIKFFQKIIEVIDDNKIKNFDKNKKRELARALHTVFGGKTEVSTQTAINEIREALNANTLDLNGILSAVKHLSDISYRWHEKYLAVDGQKAIIGGLNIADEYLLGGSDEILDLNGKKQLAWRDTDVLLHGDAACDVYRNFRRNWFYLSNHRLEKGPKITDAENGKKVAILQHRPMIDQDHNISNFILYNLRTLQEEEKAWFETAYFLPRGVLKILQKELIKAATRGVDVRILTNSEKTSDFGPLVESCIFDTRELLEAGVRVFHRNEGRMVHSKVSVFGDNLSLIGSWNFDNRSAFHDSEAACAIYDEELTAEMIATLEKDMYNDSHEIRLSNIQMQPLNKEIKSAVMLLGAELF